MNDEERTELDAEQSGAQTDEQAAALSEKLNRQRIMEAIGDKKDYEAEFLADAARRAHDEELAALANLALIRSEFEHRGRNRYGGMGSLGGGSLDARLESLLRDADFQRGNN